jgi:cobyrinic acid a,c-diamide synthase
VKIVRFSPLRDRQLPACQMIWLGGGYPELHAAGLSANQEMLAQPARRTGAGWRSTPSAAA